MQVLHELNFYLHNGTTILFNNSTMLRDHDFFGQEGVGSLVQWTEQSERKYAPPYVVKYGYWIFCLWYSFKQWITKSKK